MEYVQDTKVLNEIYNQLLPSINSIYNNYDFLGLSKEKFKQLIIEILEEIHNKQLNIDEDSETYAKRIKTYLDVYVKLRLEEPENTILILSNFINNKLCVSKKTAENLRQLKKIDKFLTKYDFIPTPDNFIELIKLNSKLTTILKSIIDENIKSIQKNGLETIDDNNLVITLIDIYCMLNNIDYQDDIEEKDIYNKIIQDYDTYTVDSVKTYLLAIQKPLLTKEEELELTIKKNIGDEQAREKLIERNLKWVVKISKGYTGRGLDLLELIQEGNIGLMIAVDRFDHTKGFRLTTYSRYWIIQSIERALAEKARNIRIPVHIEEEVKKYKKMKIALEQKLNREPTLEEIACIMGINITKLENIINNSRDTISINTIVDEDGETELENFISSEEDSPEDIYNKKYLPKDIQEILAKCNLTGRELYVLLLRNGFYSEKPKRLEEVGQMLGVTRERIRQIENKALKKIRMSHNAKKLLEYVDDQIDAEKRLQGFRLFYKTNTKSTKSLQFKKNTQEIIGKEGNNEPKEKENMKKATIFDHFSMLGFSKEQVLEAIDTLTDKQKEIVIDRHGGDLNNPIYNSNLTPSQRSMYSYVLKRVGAILVQKYRTDNAEDIESIVSPIKTTSFTKKRKAKERKSIYQKFQSQGYTREEIQDILNNLEGRDKEILILMNGSDWDNPVKSENTTKKDENHYYQVVIRKIGKRLERKYGKLKTQNECQEGLKTEVIDNLEIKPQHIEEVIVKENKVETKREFEKDDYFKILELIKTPTFGELMTKLNPKAAVIIALRLGYVDEKYFSTESIATFLGIEPEEVRETTKEILTIYKESLNSFIDQAILSLNDNEISRKLNP